MELSVHLEFHLRHRCDLYGSQRITRTGAELFHFTRAKLLSHNIRKLGQVKYVDPEIWDRKWHLPLHLFIYLCEATIADRSKRGVVVPFPADLEFDRTVPPRRFETTGWTEYTMKSELKYYYKESTGEWQYKVPYEVYPGMLCGGWVPVNTEDGKQYYYHPGSKVSSWHLPWQAKGAKLDNGWFELYDWKLEPYYWHRELETAVRVLPWQDVTSSKWHPDIWKAFASPSKFKENQEVMTDAEMLALAKESLALSGAQPFMSGWTVYETDEGVPFYHHAATQRTQWEEPGKELGQQWRAPWQCHAVGAASGAHSSPASDPAPTLAKRRILGRAKLHDGEVMRLCGPWAILKPWDQQKLIPELSPWCSWCKCWADKWHVSGKRHLPASRWLEDRRRNTVSVLGLGAK